MMVSRPLKHMASPTIWRLFVRIAVIHQHSPSGLNDMDMIGCQPPSLGPCCVADVPYIDNPLCASEDGTVWELPVIQEPQEFCETPRPKDKKRLQR